MTEENADTNIKYLGVIKNKVPLVKENTRYLRPFEYKALLQGIPKSDYKTLLNGLLYSGMRYIEAQRFQEHPEWFDGEFIHLPEMAVLKNERKQKRRVIVLNPVGRMAITHFTNVSIKLPVWQSWKDNLRRWAVKGGLVPDYINVKTTRKTYENWLMTIYPQFYFKIFQSQGHTSLTSAEHYMGLGFNEQDTRDMFEFVEGWK